MNNVISLNIKRTLHMIDALKGRKVFQIRLRRMKLRKNFLCSRGSELKIIFFIAVNHCQNFIYTNEMEMSST